jgi:hypothetical protein
MIRAPAVVLGDSLDDSDYDLWQLPFLAPDLQRVQMDCEDIKAMHQRLVGMAMCLAHHGKQHDEVQTLCREVTSSYQEVGLQIGARMGDGQYGIHTQSWLVHTTVLTGLVKGTKTDPTSLPPVACVDAMGNVAPLVDEQAPDGWVERRAYHGGGLRTCNSMTATDLVNASVWGHVYAVYVPGDGEYRPSTRAAPVDRWWTCPFVRVTQPTQPERQEAAAAFAPYHKHLLEVECPSGVLDGITPRNDGQLPVVCHDQEGRITTM